MGTGFYHVPGRASRVADGRRRQISRETGHHWDLFKPVDWPFPQAKHLNYSLLKPAMLVTLYPAHFANGLQGAE
jgi:hypothetical protein